MGESRSDEQAYGKLSSAWLPRLMLPFSNDVSNVKRLISNYFVSG